jgi:pimeloyl-ACP methyl ester carboxylesterase
MAKQASVVFIHGLWLHSSSWNPWMQRFNKVGYESGSAGWPGDQSTVKEAREHPESVAGKGLDEIVNYLAEQIRLLPEKPIIIGHSTGGLIAEKIAGMGLSKATIVIDPAPMKGIYLLPFSSLRVASIALRNPANRSRAVSLSEEQWRYGFGNALSANESKQLYEAWNVPSPGMPLFEAAFANFSRHSPAKVEPDKPGRGPMLIIGGGRDHTVPARLSKSAYKIESKSDDETELRVFKDRGHSLTIDHGWQDVADYVLHWLKSKQLQFAG